MSISGARLAGRIVVFALSPALAIALVWIGATWAVPAFNFGLVVPMTLVAISLLAGGVVFIEVVLSEIRQVRTQIEEDNRVGAANLDSSLRLLVSNQVTVLNNRLEIISAIAALMNAAADRQAKSDQAQQVALGASGGRENIVYFGASNVSPSRADVRATAPSAETGRTPVDQYFQAVDALVAQEVVIERFVRLFDEKNFPGRTREIRQGYLQWLDGQISLLETNKNYTLINARRAPRWKAIRSAVISRNSFIDILGDGESGFQIAGEAFAHAQVHHAYQYIKQGGDGAKNRYNYQNVGDLRQHRVKMERLHDKEERKAQSGESR